MKRAGNILAKLGKAGRAKPSLAAFVLCAAMGITLPAQTFTTLFAFDGLDGQGPAAPLVQGTDGNLYGTTRNGGAHLDGTVFKITPTGTLTTLYSFCSKSECADRSGSAPGAALVLGADGNFY